MVYNNIKNPSTLLLKKNSETESSNTKLTSKILTYFENGFLLFLITAISLTPYIGNKTYNAYLQVFTIIFIVIQSAIKAQKIVLDTKDLKSRSTIFKILAFFGAFAMAISGLSQLNFRDAIDISKLWSALAFSVFPFGISDICNENTKAGDYVINGVCASLLVSGIIGWYFNFNLLGTCCLIALMVKAIGGFCEKSSDKNNLKKNFYYPLAFAIVCVLVTVFCYLKGIDMTLPNLDWLLKKELPQ
ncbi:hypothetical protein GVAV_002690 [Gurleya vavrai]